MRETPNKEEKEKVDYLESIFDLSLVLHRGVFDIKGEERLQYLFSHKSQLNNIIENLKGLNYWGNGLRKDVTNRLIWVGKRMDEIIKNELTTTNNELDKKRLQIPPRRLHN